MKVGVLCAALQHGWAAHRDRVCVCALGGPAGQHWPGTCEGQLDVTSSKPDPWRCTQQRATSASVQEPLKPHTCGPTPEENDAWL